MIKDKYYASIQDIPEIVPYAVAVPATIILYCAITVVKDNIRLKKDFNPKNIKEIKITPEVLQNYSDVDTKRFYRFKNELVYLQYTKEIRRIVPESSLKNFYNNINNLNTEISNMGRLNGVAAYYKPENNTIYYSDNVLYNITETIFHELLHMSSTVCKDDMVYSGFSQKKKNNKIIIGAGLTEGYTELLTRRMYKYTDKYRYINEVEIVSSLETIIGKDKMQELYFSANLKGLVEELSKYMDEQEILKFIKRVDFIIKYDTYKENNTKREEKLLKEAYKDVYTFLLKTYVDQQKECLRKNNINQDEYINRIAKYIYSIKLDNYRGDYNLLNKKNKNEIIKKVMVNPKLDTKVHQKLYTLHMTNSN